MVAFETETSSSKSLSPSPDSGGKAITWHLFGSAGPFLNVQGKQPVRVAFILTVILGLLAGCTSIPVEQRESKRAEIDGTTEDTIIILSEKDADFSAALANAAGYFAGRASASTVAVIGGAYGIGVLVDLSTGERTYMNIKRLDLGAGLGVQKYRGVMLA
ncbi:MAG: hypothetical protein KAJ06_11700, partial [Gammaproteobacteria bacterium]|nr:hypothetical protein [Gammaproteobacteria bacterium]